MKLFAISIITTGLLAAALTSRAADTNAVPPTIGSEQAISCIGKQVIVTGKVAQVSIRPSLVFLNMDKAFPSNTFTVIIRSKNTNAFENLSALRGKAVSVKGEIKDYNGKAEMELTGKSQLKVLEETK
jgi:hypothetical protein